jgi:hypothetical protein
LKKAYTLDKIMETNRQDLKKKDISIEYYQDWMFDQVIDLFVAEYGFDPGQQREVFRLFYEAPFQKAQGIRLVALDGEIVCGFQSYFFWPYRYQGRELRTFQSGSSLVSPNYRGRQIFARLLSFLDGVEPANRPKIDFLMGFPVKMSYGSFLRNKWANPMDLVWHARPIRPLSVITAFRPEARDWGFDKEREQFPFFHLNEQFTLSKEPEFENWRMDARKIASQYLYFHHYQNGGTIRFDLKPNIRGRINELVIGDIVRSSPDPELFESGLKALIKAAKKHSFLTILTIAINERSSDKSLKQLISKNGFFQLKNRIHFIVKTLDPFPPSLDASLWNLLRSDIDTW